MTSTGRFKIFAALQLLLLFVGGVSAQTFQSAGVQTVIGTPDIMATGDFNRDGMADVVYQDSGTGGFLHIMLGNGDGTFHEVQQIALPLNVGARISVADVNNDSYPDLIVGYNGSSNNAAPPEFTALLNHGDGTFGPPIFSTFPVISNPEFAGYHIAVSDFDGDGHTDFMFAASAGLLLMRGDGTGRFIAQVVSPPVAAGMNDVYLADFNEDGKGDVAIDGIFGISFALNRGGGNFGPVTTLAQILSNPARGFSTGDIDGDGHQDIIYGYDGFIYVDYGRGDGTFATPRASGTAATPPGYSYLAIQDVNGDGRPDVITSNDGSPKVQLQNASGQFSYSYGSGPAVGDQGFLAPVFADFDGDGVGDVVTGAAGALIFSKGRSDGTFNGARSTLIGGNVLDIQPADLNKDGFLDVAITAGGGSDYGTLYTYLGDGSGAFIRYGSAPNAYPTFAGQSSVTDFNGDGIPDVFNAGYALDGDGQGGFLPATRIAIPPSGNRPEGFTVIADFNGDGRPDGVTTTASIGGSTPCTLAVGLSVGAGTWTTQEITLPYATGLFTTPICAGPLVAADFNGDGNKDLATASFASIYTYLGDGKGNFTAGPIIPIGYTAGGYYGIQSGQNDLEAADLDGDGHIDLIVPIADKNVIQIFYGRGDGTFEPAVSLPTGQDVRYVTVADMNRDGIPDMILGGHALVRILHGLGQRKFEQTPSSYAANPYPQKVRVADVNNDGNPDLLVPNGGYSVIVEPGDGFTVLLNAAPPSSPDLLFTALACAPEPSPIRQPFSCSATFTPAANSASPAGIVSFAIDGALAGTAALAAHKAVLTFPSTVPPGRHTITASFPGDANFRAVTASTTHAVSFATPTLVLSGPLHVAYGQAVPLQVVLSGNAGVPTGTVTFNDSLSFLAQGMISAGSVDVSLSTLTSGSHLLQASYSGDATYAAAVSNTLTVLVDPQPTSTVLQASPTTAVFGAAITLQATVSATAGPLSGTVQFLDGGAQIASAPIDASGNARFAASALTVGTHTLTARFVATSSLAASISAGIQVSITGIPTAITLTSTPNPSYPGQPVTLFASITAAPSQGVAVGVTGGVRFFDGTIALADVLVDARGTATLAVSTFVVGGHSISAIYLGNGPLILSQSAVVQQVVLDSNIILAAIPPSITLETQHHTTISLAVTSVGLFSGVVALGCGALPAHATCRITPQSVTLTGPGNTQTASVYLDTSDVIGYARSDAPPLSRRQNITFSAVFVLPFFAGCWLAVGRQRLPNAGRLTLLATAFLALALGSVGCSGKYPASVAPGSYTIDFNGSFGTPTRVQTAPLQMTVTP